MQFSARLRLVDIGCWVMDTGLRVGTRADALSL